MPLLAVKALGCRRAGGASVKGVSFEVDAGEVFALMGPSGSGKTTVLRTIVGFEEASEGQVLLENRDVSEMAVTELRRNVAFVAQEPVMLDGTVADNVSYTFDLRGEPPAEGQVESLLARAGLPAEFATRPAEELSSGERQRVAIARALANRPKVLLLDEPTSALDPETAKRVLEGIRQLAKEDGIAVVLVTHKPQEASRIAQRGLALDSGRVVAAGELTSLAASDEPFLRRFFAEDAGGDGEGGSNE